MVKLLLDWGADPNAAKLCNGSPHGNALTAAISRNHVPVIRLLLRNGADVNANYCDYGYTGLEFAVTVGHL